MFGERDNRNYLKLENKKIQYEKLKTGQICSK